MNSQPTHFVVDFCLRNGKRGKRTVAASTPNEARSTVQSALEAEGKRLLYWDHEPTPLCRKPKISKKDIRSSLPEEVTAEVEALQERHRTRFFDFQYHPAGSGMWLEEDANYHLFYGDREVSWRMKEEWNMTAGGPAIEFMVGHELKPPSGTFVVEFYFFCGKPIIRVHHWGPEALPGGTK